MANEVTITTNLVDKNTVKGLVAERKELKALFETAEIGSKRQLELGEQIRGIENKLHAVRQTAYGDQGRIKEAYFNSGAALRQFYMEQRVGDRTMREAAQTVRLFTGAFGVGGLTGGLEKVLGAFQQVEFATNSLGIAMQSSGGKAASFGAKLLELAGPLSVAGAVGMGVKFIVDEFARLNKELEGVQKKLEDLRVQLGEISKLGVLNRAAAEARKAKPEVGIWDQILGGIGMRLGTFEPMVAAAGKAILDVTVKQKQAQLDLERWYEERYGVTITGIRGGTPAKPGDYTERAAIGKLQGTSLGRLNRGIGTRGNIKMGVEGPSPIGTNLEDVDRMQREVTRIGDVLSDSLTQGFVRGFQNGENVFKTFLDSVLAGMASIAAQKIATSAVTSVLSLIPGIGPWLSGAAAVSGVSSSDVTQGRGGVQVGLARVEAAINSLELRVDNRGIYMATQRGGIEQATF